RNFLPSKQQKLVILPAGWSRVSNWPVDRAVFRQNDKWRACLGAGCRAVGANWLFQAFGECAGRIEHIALYGSRLSDIGAPYENCCEKCHRKRNQCPARTHVDLLLKRIASR